MKYKKGTFVVVPNREILKDKQELPKYKSGVYFLIDKEEIVYIGQTKTDIYRIITHLKEGKKKFDSYSFMEIEDAHDRDLIEALYIYVKKPKYNNIPSLKNKIKKELLLILSTQINEN